MISVIQVTTLGSEKRKKLLLDTIIPAWGETGLPYNLVCKADEGIRKAVESIGGNFVEYLSWEIDKSAKLRLGIPNIKTPWCAFLDDDIYPSDNWVAETRRFLENRMLGQYGFRLVTPGGDRHTAGEDWMAMAPAWPFADTFGQGIPMTSKPMTYDINTGEYEDCAYTYVANSVTHRDAFTTVQPFGLFNRAPDVFWSFALRDAGFRIGFNPKAVAIHAGDKTDNR